jgi:hypothetical protein
LRELILRGAPDEEIFKIVADGDGPTLSGSVSEVTG